MRSARASRRRRARPPAPRWGRRTSALNPPRSRCSVSPFSISTCADIASAWTPASVRPAACTPKLAGHAVNRFLERLLDRRPMLLPLPSHERPAVIFDREPPAGHGGSCLRDREPAQQFFGVIGDVPGRCTFSGRIAASPQATQLIVEDFARFGGARSATSASSNLIRSPFASNQAPATGSKARTCRSIRSPAAPVDPRLGLLDLARVSRARDRLRLRRLGLSSHWRAPAPRFAISSVIWPAVFPRISSVCRSASARYRAPRPSA